MNELKTPTRPRAATALAALALSLGWGIVAMPAPAAGEQAASAVMYHRFGENDYPSTNTTLEQLDAHIGELQTGGYTVMALGDIVARLKAGGELPERTVAITIDDAYLSVYTEAWPRLKAAGFPFTLFVATDAVDRATNGTYKRYMTWTQIQEISKSELVTIGSQTASHLHMADSSSEQNRADIERSNQRFIEKLGVRPDLIAYPYGEFSNDVAKLVSELGFVAGFGQHSGAFGPKDDWFKLPRFAMNENYGDTDRFKTAAGALAMTTEDVVPDNTLVDTDANPPTIGFTLPNGPASGVGCYASHEGRLTAERIGETRVEVRMTQPLPPGRTRLNCTASGPDGRFYWLGRLFYVRG